MATNGPFPLEDNVFSTYINRSIPYLDTNKVRLGIAAANITNAKAQLLLWNPLFANSQNPAVRTSAITADKTNLRKDIETQLRTIYDDIPESALTETDRLTLTLKKRDTTPTPRPKITTQPFAEMQPIGGGEIKVTVRVQNDGSRASIHPDADCIEMAYRIAGSPPASPEECEHTVTYTKAIHTLSFGVAEEGKRLYAYFRWKNDTDDAKSGPWGTLVQVIIA